MKCSKCKSELVLTPMSMCLTYHDQKKNFCEKCNHKYSDDDLQKIKEIEMIEEDMKVWRCFKKHP